jgi:hypothetical protein
MVASGASIVWCSGQGGGKIEMRLSAEESDQGWDDPFIAVEGVSQGGPGG